MIKDFNGFLPDAELKGVKLRRKANKVLSDPKLNESISLDLDQYLEIGINIENVLKSNGKLGQFNLVLKNGDELIVPKYDNSIETLGEVQKSTAITYYRGLTTKSAINKSGGFLQSAKKSSLYVVYQNGSVQSTKSFLFFRKYPKLKPGSKIYIPKKPESTAKTSVTEIVGYTTSLVSIIALLKL